MLRMYIFKIVIVVSLTLFYQTCNWDRKSELEGSKSTAKPVKKESICNEDEQIGPNGKLCWKKCPVGIVWSNGKCGNTGQESVTYEKAVLRCKELGGRLPTVEEFESILGNCHDMTTKGWKKCNKCEESNACLSLTWPLGPLYGTWGFWASGEPVKRVHIEVGWISPRFSESDIDEKRMWAACVRDSNTK